MAAVDDPLTLPWVANGALSFRGERHPLGGPGRLRHTKVEEASTGCRFELSGARVRLSGGVSAPQSVFVGWVYGDPDSSEHHTVNCSVAGLELEVKLRTEPSLSLRAPARAVYELGMRERDHGMEIQRYPDG